MGVGSIFARAKSNGRTWYTQAQAEGYDPEEIDRVRELTINFFRDMESTDSAEEKQRLFELAENAILKMRGPEEKV